jgi:hypothetical protein
MEQIIKAEQPTKEGQRLDPCPFCGCETVYYIQYENASGLRWKVCCGGCCATVDPGFAQDKGVVQRMWNRRAKT